MKKFNIRSSSCFNSDSYHVIEASLRWVFTSFNSSSASLVFNMTSPSNLIFKIESDICCSDYCRSCCSMGSDSSFVFCWRRNNTVRIVSFYRLSNIFNCKRRYFFSFSILFCFTLTRLVSLLWWMNTFRISIDHFEIDIKSSSNGVPNF